MCYHNVCLSFSQICRLQHCALPYAVIKNKSNLHSCNLEKPFEDTQAQFIKGIKTTHSLVTGQAQTNVMVFIDYKITLLLTYLKIFLFVFLPKCGTPSPAPV